ncbi:hypothetical protein F4802DRAFT_321509 [Xylaria palmicola]|nr:hypothetical protein F4802DRAFT_321509 [Xylaria palmicola]
MPLKRGIERESCDFCFRRKIRCDRSSRATGGHPACSQCDLRQSPCTFESDDVRTQRRRKVSPKRNFGADSPVGTEALQQPHLDFTSDDGWGSLTLSNNTLLSFDSSTAPNQLSLDPSIATSTQSLVTTPSLPICPEFEFEISPGDISFLDSIFLQNNSVAEPGPSWGSMPNSAMGVVNEPSNNLMATGNPYCFLDIPSEILDAAIGAYFTFASLALPTLSRNGFMADYRAHRSSTALVCAVACRGCPFMQSTSKWTLQQRFASRFREVFLQARSTAASQDVVRLDDLEALALMVGFEYESFEDFTSPLQSQLQALLLTHDSLVMMTLQCRIETCFTAAATEGGTSITLSEASQRQKILFWYVYGWDAFCSLDRKVASRVRDEDIDLPPRVGDHQNQDYFDAVLSLAAIAHKMTRALCGPVARRKGIKHRDIEDIYNQLREWRLGAFPSTFKDQPSSDVLLSQKRLLLFGPESKPKELPPLHKAILTLLELNCFMQLEACVSQYGIEERGSLMGHIIDMRVKYETLQAAYKIVEVARWIEALSINQGVTTTAITYVMADLAPEIIRNICAGAATWISRRAVEILRPTAHEKGETELSVGRPDVLIKDGAILTLPREGLRSWMESSTALRNIAATATSHRDTEPLVERLEQQLRHLKELVNINEAQHVVC